MELFLFCVNIRIHQDTTTELANNDFLAEANIQLSLCWNFAVATAATIALNLYNRQSIVCIFADTMESCDQTLFNMFLPECIVTLAGRPDRGAQGCVRSTPQMGVLADRELGIGSPGTQVLLYNAHLWRL